MHRWGDHNFCAKCHHDYYVESTTAQYDTNSVLLSYKKLLSFLNIVFDGVVQEKYQFHQIQNYTIELEMQWGLFWYAIC